MQVRLTRRLANHVNGVDLTLRSVGDVIDVSPQDGEMLVAEGWATAVPIERNGDRRRMRATANDSAPRKHRP